MPLILWLVFLRISYSQKPLEYIPNMVMSAGVLFFIMTWIGYSYMDLEDPISEQLIILKLQNMSLYNISKLIFLLMIALVISGMGVGFPILQNMIEKGTLFKRVIVASDVVGGVLLHGVIAFMGLSVGALYHPRIMRNRKMAVLMALTTALIGYTSGILKSELPFTRFVVWLFPQAYEILESFNGLEFFNVSNMTTPLLYGIIYCLILNGFQLLLLKKIRY